MGVNADILQQKATRFHNQTETPFERVIHEGLDDIDPGAQVKYESHVLEARQRIQRIVQDDLDEQQCETLFKEALTNLREASKELKYLLLTHRGDPGTQEIAELYQTLRNEFWELNTILIDAVE